MSNVLYAEKAINQQVKADFATYLEGAYAAVEMGLTAEGLTELFESLEEARNTMDAETWAEFGKYVRTEHPLRQTVYEDPMTRRAFEKPRGYAGDAVMMDYLYNLHSSEEAAGQASELGRELFRCIQERPAGQAVRFRREHIAGLIDELAANAAHASVLAIAAGHLREAEVSKALASGKVERFVALDADSQSLHEVSSLYGKLGVETVHGSVRQILARKVKLGTFDFVYAAGLYDYLNDAVARALTARMFEMTAPGGRILIPNFATDIKDRAYMETYMDWDLVYRNEYDMVQLLTQVDLSQVESYDVYHDPSQSIVFLSVIKRK